MLHATNKRCLLFLKLMVNNLLTYFFKNYYKLIIIYFEICHPHPIEKISIVLNKHILIPIIYDITFFR